MNRGLTEAEAYRFVAMEREALERDGPAPIFERFLQQVREAAHEVEHPEAA